LEQFQTLNIDHNSVLIPEEVDAAVDLYTKVLLQLAQLGEVRTEAVHQPFQIELSTAVLGSGLLTPNRSWE